MANLDFFDGEIIPITQDFSTLGKRFGQGKQKTLVILPATQFDEATYKALLKKILLSVQIEMEEDVVVLALASKRPFSLIHLAEKDKFEKIIVFGVPLPQASIHRLIPKYQIAQINQFELIGSDGFPELERDSSKKLKFALWNSLKELFGK